MSRRDDTGDGDTCPLFPAHGNMHVMSGSHPPRQRCIHQTHDGGKGETPASRSSWPLHGFEDAVLAHNARAARDAGLPDLSDLPL